MRRAVCAGGVYQGQRKTGRKDPAVGGCKGSPCHAHLEPTFNSAKAEVVKKKQQEQRLDGGTQPDHGAMTV